MMHGKVGMKRMVIVFGLVFFGGLIGPNTFAANGDLRFDSVMVPMADGVLLATDIYLPAEEGQYPVVLMRTPYAARQRSFLGNGLAPKGFAVVVQNVRGQNGSEGQFIPFVYEKSDGVSTVEWILKQPWCNGKIGLWGSSYNGYAAFELVSTGHPAIGAVFHVSGWSDLGAFMAHGGAFQLQAHLYWFINYASGQSAPPKKAWPQIFRTVPIAQFFPGSEAIEEFATAPYDYAAIKAPIMHVTGWYDYIYPNVLQTYNGVAGSHDAQEQRLIVGPWSHNGVLNSWTKVGEVEFGENAAAGIEWAMDLTAQWFDHVLSGEQNELSQSKPVRYFVMGDNQWIEDDIWPPSNVEYLKWYVGEGGSLSPDKPTGDGYSKFVYDPDNPVPTVGGANSHFFPDNLGPKDQRVIGDRDDILIFTSEPLKADITIAGPISAVVFAATTAKDTDFTAKLSVVRPDGLIRNVEDGIVRGRFLFEGTDSTGYIAPAEINAYRIDCGATALAVKAGERLQLAISSSNFPKYDRNPNTGVDPFYASEFVPATQTVYYSSEYPTHVVVPVLK
jgi:predicted acyl esterase